MVIDLTADSESESEVVVIPLTSSPRGLGSRTSVHINVSRARMDLGMSMDQRDEHEDDYDSIAVGSSSSSSSSSASSSSARPSSASSSSVFIPAIKTPAQKGGSGMYPSSASSASSSMVPLMESPRYKASKALGSSVSGITSGGVFQPALPVKEPPAKVAKPQKKTGKSGKGSENKKHTDGENADAANGKSSLADGQHYRFECALNDFGTRSFLTCADCVCYVCHESAANCKQWDDHCGADPEDAQYGAIWTSMKDESARRRAENLNKDVDAGAQHAANQLAMGIVSINRKDLYEMSRVPMTLAAWRLLTPAPAKPVQLQLLRSYEEKLEKLTAKKRKQAARGPVGYYCGNCNEIHYRSDDEGGPSDESDSDDDAEMTDDDLLNAGGGSFTYVKSAKKHVPAFTLYHSAIQGQMAIKPDFAPYSGEMVNVIGRLVPKNLFVERTMFPRVNRDDNLAGTFADAILVRMLRSMDMPLSTDAKIDPHASITYSQSFSARTFQETQKSWYTLVFEMDTSALEMTKCEKLRKWLDGISTDLGGNYAGERMFSYTLSYKTREQSASAVALTHLTSKKARRRMYAASILYNGVKVKCNFRRWFPPGSEPVRMSTYNINHDILIGRTICPLCLCASPESSTSYTCAVCKYYMSHADSVPPPDAKQQLAPGAYCVELGEPYTFDIVLKPDFLFSKRKRDWLPGFTDVVDPFCMQIVANQVECFKANALGRHPKIQVLKEMCKSEYPYVHVLNLMSEFVGLGKGSSKDATICPESAYFSEFLDMCSSVLSPLVVVCTVENAVLTEQQLQRVPVVERNIHAASCVRITFQLFLDMNPVLCKNGTFDFPPHHLQRLGHQFWNSSKMAISAFCSPRGAPAAIEALGQNKRAGLHIPPASLLISSAGSRSGGFADLSTGFSKILACLHGEALHLGMTPFGFAMCDPCMYPKDKLTEQYKRLIDQDESLATQRRDFNQAIGEGASVCRNLAYSSGHLLTEIENLGHSGITTAQAQVLRTGLNVELRDYQKQSLRWALDQEYLPGGLMSLITAPLPNREGGDTGVYYSPFTGAFSATPPIDVRGGLICEEMGMGKTIITLGLILCHPAPIVTNNEAAAADWGAFSPLLNDRSQKEALAQNKMQAVGQIDKPENAPEVADANAMGVVVAEDTDTGQLPSDCPNVRSRGTLVICPVSLVGQWVSEARAKLSAGAQLKVYEYHGTKRLRDPQVLASYDLVVTTYETLAADIRTYVQGGAHTKTKRAVTVPKDFKEKGKHFPAVHRINWYRIVMDESHKSKGKTGVSSSLYSLFSKRRWCVTGTPISTQTADLAGQFGAIGIPALRDPTFWTTLVPKAAPMRFQSEDGSIQPGTAALTALMRRVCMRHSKDMKYASTGDRLLTLPPKVEHIQWIKFSEEEEAQYRQLEQYMKVKYEKIVATGWQAVSKHTIQLLSMVKDLQMVCSGGYVPERLANILNRDPSLLIEDIVPEPVEDVMDRTQDGECPICLSLYDSPADTLCKHRFCRVCIESVIAQSNRPECPLCRKAITIGELRDPDGKVLGAAAAASAAGSAAHSDTIYNAAMEPANEAERKAGQKKSDTCILSKVAWLVQKLQEIRTSDSTAKVLVFSQFASTLEWLQEELPRRGYQFRTLTGSMTMVQRKHALDAFQNDPPTSIFLLSMRAGAVGINLTQANHVVVLEPCLNTALADQAIGRVHRMGQRREVHVYRVACLGSVEERILKFQAQKALGAAAPASATGAGGAGAGALGTGASSSAEPLPVADGEMQDQPATRTAAQAPAPADRDENVADWKTLPLEFSNVHVSSSKDAAHGKQNLLTLTDMGGWVPRPDKLGFSCCRVDIPHSGDYELKDVRIEVKNRQRLDSYDLYFGYKPPRAWPASDAGLGFKSMIVDDSDCSVKPTSVDAAANGDGAVTLVSAADFRKAKQLMAGETSLKDVKIRWVAIVFKHTHVAGETQDTKHFEARALQVRGIPGPGAVLATGPDIRPRIVMVNGVLRMFAEVQAALEPASRAVRVQETTGSIQSDRAAVNREQFDALFGTAILPATLMQDTKTPLNTFAFTREEALVMKARDVVAAPAPKGAGRGSSNSAAALDEFSSGNKRPPARASATKAAARNKRAAANSDSDEDEAEVDEEGYLMDSVSDEEDFGDDDSGEEGSGRAAPKSRRVSQNLPSAPPIAKPKPKTKAQLAAERRQQLQSAALLAELASLSSFAPEPDRNGEGGGDGDAEDQEAGVDGDGGEGEGEFEGHEATLLCLDVGGLEGRVGRASQAAGGRGKRGRSSPVAAVALAPAAEGGAGTGTGTAEVESAGATRVQRQKRS